MKELWVFGSGISLDTFDYNMAGPDRVALNLSAYVVPDILGAFTVDYNMLRHYEKYLLGLPVYTTPSRHTFDLPIVLVDVPKNQKSYSAQAVIFAFEAAGYSKFYMVGFDSRFGNSGYAKRIHTFCESCPYTNLNRPRDYAPINKKIDSLESDSEIIWMHG